MIDNFILTADLLTFDGANSFYFVQLLKRRKENHEMKKHVVSIDYYYFYSKEEMEGAKESIINKCTLHNARAYINVNQLDAERVAMFTLQKITNLIIQHEYRAVKNAYNSVCGSLTSELMRRWVVDIDSKNPDEIAIIRAYIAQLHQEVAKENYTILAQIPTRNGVHLITHPFNLQSFGQRFPDVEVHKNNPTLLYIP